MEHFVTFTPRRMSVEVADGKFVQATGYGSMAHPLLTKVWYVPEFEGRPMLFSENQAMLDNHSSQRKKTVIFRDEDTDEQVFSGKLENKRFVLKFDFREVEVSSSATKSKLHEESTAHAFGTGMSLLPTPVHSVLMHRRTNHHGPTSLHAAVSRDVTTGLCASLSTATLAQLSTIDCLACTLGKSKYADHVSVNPVLREQGIERQGIPGHVIIVVWHRTSSLPSI